MSRPVRVIKAEDRTIVIRETVAVGIDCAHCTRMSLTMDTNGTVTWLAPHGKEAHPNATSMVALNKVFLTIAHPKDLKLLREAIDERLREAA